MKDFKMNSKKIINFICVFFIGAVAIIFYYYFTINYNSLDAAIKKEENFIENEFAELCNKEKGYLCEKPISIQYICSGSKKHCENIIKIIKKDKRFNFTEKEKLPETIHFEVGIDKKTDRLFDFTMTLKSDSYEFLNENFYSSSGISNYMEEISYSRYLLDFMKRIK